MVKLEAPDTAGTRALWSVVGIGVTAFFFILGVSVFSMPDYAKKTDLEGVRAEVEVVKKEIIPREKETAERLARIETKLELIWKKMEKSP